MPKRRKGSFLEGAPLNKDVLYVFVGVKWKVSIEIKKPQFLFI